MISKYDMFDLLNVPCPFQANDIGVLVLRESSKNYEINFIGDLLKDTLNFTLLFKEKH